MTPTRKRLAWLFIATGVGLIVEHTVASGGDDESQAAATATDAQAAAVVRSPASAASSAQEHGLKVERLARRAESSAAPASTASNPAPTAKASPKAPTRAASAASSPQAASAPGPESLFAVQTWLPPAPPPAPRPPPPPPVFPYSYMGGMTDENGRTAYFRNGDRVIAARAEDTIDGTWHIDRLDDRQMNLTYLPLKISSVVATGGHP